MDEMEWAPADPGRQDLFTAGDVTIRPAPQGGALLIQGDAESAIAAIAPGAPLIGLGGRIPDRSHALRIARDRVLLRLPAPVTFRAGWHSGGYSVIPADDLYRGMILSGQGARELAGALTHANIEAGSPSAAIRLADAACLLAGTQDGFLILAERSLFHAVWTLACRTAAGLAGQA